VSVRGPLLVYSSGAVVNHGHSVPAGPGEPIPMRTSMPQCLAIFRSFLLNCAPNLKSFLAAVLLVPALLAAQTTATPPAATAAPKAPHHHVRSVTAHPSSALTPTAPAPAAAPVPATPNWPVNEQPAPASVIWDSNGLRIEASNSSLQKILSDVATATGARLEGMGPDERVFGEYGPGQARDVLSQLLQGSGYNILMIGEQGQGVPRQIVLSARHSGNPSQPANPSMQGSNDDDTADSEVDDQQPPATAPVIRPVFGQGAPVRTPQQILQEMQQRQQQQQTTQPPPMPPDSKPPNE